MKLEEIAKMYGMTVDYLDHNTGYIYELSRATDNGDGTLKVPVRDGTLIGYASMDK